MKITSSIYATLAMLASSCAATTEPPKQGQTHWLDVCESDADCGELECACGVCVAPCERGACSVDGRQTTCFAASSEAVEAMCAPSEALALCLQPCGEGCGEGESCEGGACVARARQPSGGAGGGEPSTPQPDAGGEGGSIGDAPIEVAGAGGAPGQGPIDAGEPDARIPIPPFEPIAFSITIVNALETPIVIEVSDCNGQHGWHRMREVGYQPLQLYSTCPCRSFQAIGQCPGTPTVCQHSEYETVAPGESYTRVWDGGHWRNEAGFPCQNYAEFPRDATIETDVCWYDAMPASDTQVPERCVPHAFTLEEQGSGIVFEASAD